MRQVIRDELLVKHARAPISHMGLVYNILAPVDSPPRASDTADHYKVPVAERSPWFQRLEGAKVPDDYERFYTQWLDSLRADRSEALEGTLSSRMLVGHGEASAVEVGLTFHHTWGVPMIPGSALKGLLSNYLQANYGPDPSEKDPDLAAQRERFRGVTWQGNTIKRGPGDVSRVLFGAPEAEQDDDAPDQGATRGAIIFHDALLIPERAPCAPLAHDVLTVHQKDYYNQRDGLRPNDYDDPNPVSFLTVRPKIRFLIALSGPADWLPFTLKLLQEALCEWGVGGKTSLGYGRFEPSAWHRPEALRRPEESWQAWVLGSSLQEQRALLERVRGLDAQTLDDELRFKRDLIVHLWRQATPEGISDKKWRDDYLPLIQAHASPAQASPAQAAKPTQDDSPGQGEPALDLDAMPELLRKAYVQAQSKDTNLNNTLLELLRRDEFRSYDDAQLERLSALMTSLDAGWPKFLKTGKDKDLSKKARAKELKPLRDHLTSRQG